METSRNEHESESDSNSGDRNTRENANRRVQLERRRGNTGPRETVLWTFILHKSNMATENPEYNSRSPTYIRFDHGDHYHIVFASNPRGNNINKQQHRILRDLTASDRGITEATTTTQQVRNEQKFLQYCVRKGLSTYTPVNIKNNEKLTNLHDTITNKLIINENELELCTPYIENKQPTENKTTKILRSNIVERIKELIEKYNIESYTQFKQKIDSETQEQLIIDYSMQSMTLTKELLSLIHISEPTRPY